MQPLGHSERRQWGVDRGEWTVLTYDVDRPCVVCENYLHRGQAVGYIKGQLVHAKCYREGEESSPGRAPSAA
jgi:hypothetical protein